jgi:hypothetical protein
MKNPNQNPENNVATVLVLEAIAMMSLMAGASKEEAVENAAQLFAAAYRETEMHRFEAMLADDAE